MFEWLFEDAAIDSDARLMFNIMWFPFGIFALMFGWPIGAIIKKGDPTEIMKYFFAPFGS